MLFPDKHLIIYVHEHLAQMVWLIFIVASANNSGSRKNGTTQPDPATRLIRTGVLMAVPELLRQSGQDPVAAFNQAGLNLSCLDDPDTTVPFVAMGRLMEHCVAITGCDHFGLLVGQHAKPSALGIAGFVLQHAPDVRTALEDFKVYLNLQDQGGVLSLSFGDSVSALGYAIFERGVPAIDQIYAGAMGVAFNILLGICGTGWRPVEVLLSVAKPRAIGPYERFFRAPVRFDSEQSALLFPSRWLDVRPKRADALLYRHLKREADELQRLMRADFGSRLQGLLRISILSDDCSLQSVATRLGHHPRTLNRRLQSTGTTFRAELAAARYHLGRQFLGTSDLSVADIASMLGYASTSAFSHAFKRQAGIGPLGWRESKKSGPPHPDPH